MARHRLFVPVVIACAMLFVSVAPAAEADVFTSDLSASGTTSSLSPTIASDKGDYAPGALVTLSGGNWQPGEVVHINVNDDLGATWSRDVDVSADGSGFVSDSFNLPDWFVAHYVVTASGASGATATTEFTDASIVWTPNVEPNATPPTGYHSVDSGNSFDFNATATKAGTGANPTITGIAGVGGPGTDQCVTGNPAAQGATLPSDWVSIVSPTSAQTITTGTAFTFRVSVPSGQAVGNYAGNISFSGSATGGATIRVCVTVTAPAKQNQTIDFSAPSGVTYGDADSALGATAGSGLAVSYASTTPSVCTIVDGTKLHVVSAGSCSITASQAGNASYFAAPDVTRTFDIDPATVTVTASSPADITYGDAAPSVTPSYSGWVNGEDESVLTTPAGCDSDYTQGDGVGSYTTSCSGAVAPNYEFSYTDGGFDVLKKGLVAHISDEEMTYGDATLPTFEASYADGAFVGDDTSAVVGGTLACESTDGYDAGTHDVSCSGLSADNYDISYSGGSLLVHKATLNIDADNATTTYGEGDPAASSLTYTFSGFKGDDDADNSGITGDAACSIASHSGDAGNYTDVITCEPGTLDAGNYTFQAGAKGDLTIEKADQTITFPAITDKTLAAADFDPGATSSSGLAVSYVASPSGVCTIVSGKVHIVGIGTCEVTASQAGNSNWNQADDVSRTFGVDYPWTGFFQPIDNSGVLNKAKAGSTIPVKFSLGADRGLAILWTADTMAYPRSVGISCPISSTVDTIETYTDATSGLKYDALANQYIYNWKTASSWSASCRQLIVKLADGTTHAANFQFVK